MDDTQEGKFAAAFARLTQFKTNPFHPLVWINGEPEIGKNVYIGGMSEINATKTRVTIGDGCDIASFVSINAADSHRTCIGLSDEVERNEIILEHNVFVGSHCVIKGGAHIGHHSVVAAGTIVDARKIPPYSLVIGNPMIVKEWYYQKPGAARGPVPHNRPSMGRDEERAAAEVIRSAMLAQGAHVKAFEDEFCAFLGLPPGHAVAVSSGTAALYLALHALGAQKKRVAYPAYTCSALTNACKFAAAEPVLLDNAAGSPNIDLALLDKAQVDIAIVPHTYGIPLDLSAVKGKRIIEDCAQAVGARVNGKPVGLQGDVGVFSFYATKLMTSGGQGGMIVSRDRKVAEAARDFREFDQRHDQKARFNLQMTDLQAAIGRAQLKRLPEFLAKRQNLFDIYREAGLDLLTSKDANLQPVRFRAVMRTPNPAQIIAALNDIGARAIVPLEDWEMQGAPASFPHANRLCRETVSLPLYPTLAEEDAARIAKAARA
jgi:perosamine synthetase